ncbi:DUF4174 domain-containing protein [Aureimonas sp. ME7]|uniref:DUF4174 domain-containing protein n=1 Tax=Aureimonas sp. ME7 TaxID=2744252 RepID=UPI0015F8CD67|nr:DUF4174 domain-containing protein [Aureimonas sp. ME7]
MLTTIVATLAMTAAASAMPSSVTALKWERRVLIVFAPTPGDPRWQEQAALLDGQDRDLEERRMEVLAVVGDDVNPVRGKAARESDGAGWRRTFRVSNDEFAIVLIGLDGGVKWRADAPAPLADINAVVDAMPMRRGNRSR